MPTIEESIENALLGHARLLDVTGDPPIAWPNDDFPGEDAQGQPIPKPATFIKVTVQKNRNSRYFMNGADPHLRQGILQFDVYTPLRVGPAPATKLAGEIADHFPADFAMFKDGLKVRVQQAPDPTTAEKTSDGVSWSTRIDVRFDCFA